MLCLLFMFSFCFFVVVLWAWLYVLWYQRKKQIKKIIHDWLGVDSPIVIDRICGGYVGTTLQPNQGTCYFFLFFLLLLFVSSLFSVDSLIVCSVISKKKKKKKSWVDSPMIDRICGGYVGTTLQPNQGIISFLFCFL